MKIECPHCHLSGELNDQDVPLDGRYIDCPRCNTGFHVKKPPTQGWNPNLMSVCPHCNYSTFTDEMFEVCPKCGLQGSVYQEKKRKQEEAEQHKQDMERLQRSYRQDDFIKAPSKEPEAAIPLVPAPVRYTGWGVMAVAALVAVFGFVGVMGYHGQDLYTQINETALEPVSRGAIFFRHGLFPWVLTLYGSGMLIVASQFVRLQRWSLKGLEWGGWVGLAIGAGYEIADFVGWVRRSSDSPSLLYYLVGLVTTLFMIALWVALPLALIWWLRHERITDEFLEP